MIRLGAPPRLNVHLSLGLLLEGKGIVKKAVWIRKYRVCEQRKWYN
jgi:hypothetical protein